MENPSQITFITLTGTILMLFMALLVIYFVTTHRRRYIEQKNRIALLALENERNLFAAIIKAQEQERYRIARNIHDDIGVKLSMFQLNTSTSIHQPSMPKDLKENLLLQLSFFEQIIDDISDTCLDLYPVSLKRIGLILTLKAHLERVAQNSKIQCTDNIDISPTTLTLEPDQQLNLLRIFQEILNNILKYSDCTHLDVNVHAEKNLLYMAFVHNGIAFSDNDAAGKISTGIGLESIANRVNVANGTIVYEALADGSKVFVTLPLNP